MGDREDQIWGVEREPSGETIHALLVPALGNLAVEAIQLGKSDLSRRQEMVLGLIDYVELIEPPASIILNDEGLLLGLPFNYRATELLWAGNRYHRGQTALVGNVLVVGPADEQGDDTDVPAELVELFLGNDE